MPKSLNSYKKILSATILSIISCLGTLYYGYHFADFLKPYSSVLSIIFGALFAFFSASANAALGLNALLNFIAKKHISLCILLLSFLSAIPTGILSYFAFKTYLSVFFNLIVMISIILTNASINYTAILNSLNQLIKQRESCIQKAIRSIGFIIGALVSTSFYMATINGVSELLRLYFSNKTAFNLACLSGFIIWLPNAALFGSSTQQCFSQIYMWAIDQSQSIKEITISQMIIFIFSFLSAGAYTQIAIIFFDVKMTIPDFIKWDNLQFFIYHFLIPMTFLSALFVNYLALISLVKKIKNR